MKSQKFEELQKLQTGEKQAVLQGIISDRDRLVKRSETNRILLKCQLTAGGYRGRDATTGKVKERYYWPNFYKEIKEKVHIAVAQATFTLNTARYGYILTCSYVAS